MMSMRDFRGYFPSESWESEMIGITIKTEKFKQAENSKIKTKKMDKSKIT